MLRKPIVAGHFYSDDPKALQETLADLIPQNFHKEKVIAVVAPHAAYIYSGATAGKTFARAKIPNTCIVLSPKHTRYGERAAIMTEGIWETPLGKMEIAADTAKKLLNKCKTLKNDAHAHAREHSLEVQLPFLQTKNSKTKIIPIALGQLSIDEVTSLGLALAATIKESAEDILIVASSDMNHYEHHTLTMEKDQLAIDRVLALDPEGLLHTCAENDITMCGVIPTAVAITAAKELGATQSILVEHTTSAETSGIKEEVVGYAGFVFK